MCRGYAVKKKEGKMPGVELRVPGRFNVPCCANRYIIAVVTQSPEKIALLLKTPARSPSLFHLRV